MDSERWHRIDRLLDEALERPPGERSRFLDQVCGDDDDLRSEVQALLAAEVQADGFLETPPAELGRPSDGSDRLGPYRIERPLGQGGMAIVYQAVRVDDSFRRRVAIKLINPGMMSPTVVRRFHGERHILAALDHPNIARLYDGGTSQDGRPYLVMELIEGEPIDAYCDHHRLPVGERIALFRRVCSAVHYAHQHLVVHRDIKPSNILVNADGVPNLLDFGIAKLLDPEALSITVEATATGVRPMTPHYASPEQVRGEVISTASDVYSLGVLLYKLLTGRLPHRLSGLLPREVEQVLSDEVPERPSLAITRGAAENEESGWPDNAETVSRRRGSRPQQLRRRLAGDLDNIVLKALSKDPRRRYASAEQLSEDLDRHLRGLPVVARHSTLGYRAGRFLRRNKLWVGIVAAVLALVLAFALAMARQATQIAHHLDRAEAERERAEGERERAERVSSFLVDLFEEFDPWETSGETVTARQILDRGADRIDRELHDQPEVRASLLDAIGTVYGHLGLYDEADAHLRAGLAVREERLGPEHLDVADSQYHLAALYVLQGRYAEAEPLLRHVLAVRERELGDGDPGVAEALREQSTLYRVLGRFAEAEASARRALAIHRRVLGPEHPEVAVTLRALAGVRARQGEIAEAEELLESALAIEEKVYGESHWRTAANLANLGFLHAARGDFEGGEVLARRALAIYEEILHPDHPQVAQLLVHLANTLKPRGRYGEAERLLRRALAIYEGALEENHSLIGNCLYELGRVTLLQGRLAAAEPLLVRSLAIREQSLGSEHPWVAESLQGLADLRRAQGRGEEAIALYERAFAIWQEHPRNQGTEGAPEALAELLRAAGREAEAVRVEERAAEVMGADSGG